MATEKATLTLILNGNMVSGLEKFIKVSQKATTQLERMIRLQGQFANSSGKMTRGVKNATAQMYRQQRAAQELVKTQNSVVASQKRVSTGFSMLVPTLAVAGLAKLTGSYNKSMGKIATLTNVTTAEIKSKFGDEFKDLAIKNGQSLGSITEGAYNAVSAGIKPENLTTFMKYAGDVGLATKSSVNEAVDLMSNLKNAFGTTAEAAATASYAAVRFGKTTGAELAQSIGLVSPVAKSLGVSLEETMATMSGLTAAGLKTPVAVTALRAVLTGVVKQTRQQKKAQDELGITFNTNTIRQMGLMKSVIWLQSKIAAKTSDRAKQEQLLGQVLGQNVRSLVGALSFQSDIAQNQAAQAAQSMGKGAQFLAENAEKVRSQMGFQKMIEQFKVLAITIGEAVMPVLSAFANGALWIAQILGGWIKQNAGLVKLLAKLFFIVMGVNLALKIGGGVINLYTKLTTLWTSATKAQTFWTGALGMAIKSLLMTSGILILLPLLGKLINFGSSILGGGSGGGTATTLGTALTKDFAKMQTSVNGSMDQMSNKWKAGLGQFGGAKGKLGLSTGAKAQTATKSQSERISTIMKSFGYNKVESTQDVLTRYAKLHGKEFINKAKSEEQLSKVNLLSMATGQNAKDMYGRAAAMATLSQRGISMDHFSNIFANLQEAFKAGDVARFDKLTAELGMSKAEVDKNFGAWRMLTMDLTKAREAQGIYNELLKRELAHKKEIASISTGGGGGGTLPMTPFTPGAGNAQSKNVAIDPLTGAPRLGIKQIQGLYSQPKNQKNVTQNLTMNVTFNVSEANGDSARQIRSQLDDAAKEVMKRAAGREIK